MLPIYNQHIQFQSLYLNFPLTKVYLQLGESVLNNLRQGFAFVDELLVP